MSKTIYDYRDRAAKYLNKEFVRLFAKIKRQLAFDEINALQSVSAVYDECYEKVKRTYQEIAARAYAEARGMSYNDAAELKECPDGYWVIEFLERYDPTTKYVFSHEIERKKERLTEGLLASKTSSDRKKQVETALRLWSAQAAQYATEAVDEARNDAFKDEAVERVRWVTIPDEKRCHACQQRDGQIYPINEVPDKPHIGCRCYLVPVDD